MLLSVNFPVAPVLPAVAQLQILQHNFSELDNLIYLSYNELDVDGYFISNKNMVLDPTDTSSFFATSVDGYVTLQDVFDAAVASVLANIYGPLTITSP
jgi:hypothetical protein